ncbi:hypothetical protein SBOR_1596 [Sclerotinia borealis F-4128]|uniref:Uncharacterized protein n=1 Tax=Sclerotinia borealis (strain F-4128) TaxID=1432307 RepID=W9CU74_SCLBF|nr:hypothetical protein SBOR_1596 [Sclerotinia borealis F-4128]
MLITSHLEDPTWKAPISLPALAGTDTGDECTHEILAPWEFLYSVPQHFMTSWSAEATLRWNVFHALLQYAEEERRPGPQKGKVRIREPDLDNRFDILFDSVDVDMGFEQNSATEFREDTLGCGKFLDAADEACVCVDKFPMNVNMIGWSDGLPLERTTGCRKLSLHFSGLTTTVWPDCIACIEAVSSLKFEKRMKAQRAIDTGEPISRSINWALEYSNATYILESRHDIGRAAQRVETFLAMFSLRFAFTVTLLALPSVECLSNANLLVSNWQNSTVTHSQGGNALCFSGKVPVPVIATTTKLLLPKLASQTEVTQIFQELLQSNSNIVTTAYGGTSAINQTFQIDATYCVPTSNSSAKTIQILTHGIGLDKSYWDISPGYSYVDAAAVAGYATLAYNRLGVGGSDHPDPLQIVQASIDVEIQHGLTSLIWQGWLNKNFKSVIGVGHSYGSIIQLAQNAKYPNDVNGTVLTGFVNDVASLSYTIAANNPAVAAINNPKLWGNLSYGYVVHDTAISIQLPFFRAPYFPESTFNHQVAQKQTYTIGQQFTLPTIYSTAPKFTGPVDIVIGRYDFPFCKGMCNHPIDLAAATIPVLYPAANAKSESFVVPDSGHLINAHYRAGAQFDHINGFLVVALSATLAVTLRFVSRTFIKSFGADDWLILAALPLGWGMAICTIIAVHYGLGQHALSVPPENLVPFIKVYFASEVIWACSMGLIKISILLLYVRIFGSLRYFRILAYGFGGFTFAWAVMVVIVCTFQCLPVAYQWDKTIEGGKCIDSWLFFTIGSSFDVLVDLALLILPIPAVWNLQLSVLQKLSVIAIFCLGSLTCVFSLIRLVAVAQDKNDPDPTFSLGIVAIWSTAEPCLGIVSTCLPTYKPIIIKLFGQKKEVGGSGASKSIGGNSTFGSKFKKNGGRVTLTSGSENEDDLQLVCSQKELLSLQTYATTGGDSTPNGQDIPMDNIHVRTKINSTWSHNV